MVTHILKFCRFETVDIACRTVPCESPALSEPLGCGVCVRVSSAVRRGTCYLMSACWEHADFVALVPPPLPRFVSFNY